MNYASVMNLNNRITALNKLLTAEFNLVEPVAFTSVLLIL